MRSRGAEEQRRKGENGKRGERRVGGNVEPSNVERRNVG
jgi:hypothetical protein